MLVFRSQAFHDALFVLHLRGKPGRVHIAHLPRWLLMCDQEDVAKLFLRDVKDIYVLFNSCLTICDLYKHFYSVGQEQSREIG
jgi:hypothetical protein